MQVSQRAAGANMSVDIAAGHAVIFGDDVAGQGVYSAYNDGVVNLAIAAAHASLPRVDRVCLRLRDAFHGGAANDFAFVVVAGTPTSGATLSNLSGAAAVPANHLLLANVLVPAAAASILAANIGDVRPFLSPSNSRIIGQSIDYNGTDTPSGTLPEDGSAVSRTQYAALFAKIGTSFGAGDGSTTFNLPDSRGRVLVAQGTHASVDGLGDADAVAVASRAFPITTGAPSSTNQSTYDNPSGLTTHAHPDHVHTVTIPYRVAKRVIVFS